MRKRTSTVKQIFTNSVSHSSVFSIGDTGKTNQKVKAIAVQTPEEQLDIDVDFHDYSIFSRKANVPKMTKPHMKKKTFHHQPNIHVQSVNINAISNSSVFQVGSLENVQAESRLKHIRMINDEQ